GNRQRSAAQIEQRCRLAAGRAEHRIGHVGGDRSLQAVRRDVEIEPTLRLVIERQRDFVDGVRAALRVEIDVGVDLGRYRVEFDVALYMRPGGGEVEREIAVADRAVEHDLAEIGGG